MLLLLIGFLLFTGSGVYKYYTLSRELEAVRSLSTEVIETNNQMYKTIATGLYHRFKRENTGATSKVSGSFIRNSPYEFEYFIADILEGVYGGQTYVTQDAGEYGVEMEHTRNGNLFLIHVICTEEDAGVEPIAAIHSQTVRQEAKGGVAVSASGFTQEARNYARDVGIELIDGIQLANYWSIHLQKKERQLADSSPRPGGLQPVVT
jgi:restriction system protein